jgi:hypothetical protein
LLQSLDLLLAPPLLVRRGFGLDRSEVRHDVIGEQLE